MPETKKKKEDSFSEAVLKAANMKMTQNMTLQVEGDILEVKKDGIIVQEGKEKLAVNVNPEYTAIYTVVVDSKAGKKESKEMKVSDIRKGSRAIVNCYYDRENGRWSAIGISFKKIKG